MIKKTCIKQLNEFKDNTNKQLNEHKIIQINRWNKKDNAKQKEEFNKT
jgi:hypothetical protein